jgi:hypothetical protein
MKCTLLSAVITASALLFFSGLLAQDEKPRYEFGINLGFLVYQGDLTPNRIGAFETQKFSVGLHASRILNSTVLVRGHLLLGKLKGDDAVYTKPEYRQQRNFNFTSPVTELTAQMVYNPLGRNYIEKGFSPYVFAGVGLSLVKVNRDWSNFNAEYFGSETSEISTGLAADAARNTPRLLPVIPIGSGIKYFFTPRLAANVEASYRLTRTDYLDGFSQAANAQKGDHYLNYSAGIIYRTGSKNKLNCPKIKY